MEEVRLMRKSAKHVAQGKHKALVGQAGGELTCSESQVENMFSPGESTEDERISPAKVPGVLCSRSDE